MVAPGSQQPRLRTQHYKLKTLKSTKLRYEVVYKNLLRDFRKFFIADFNSSTDYLKNRRRQAGGYFRECLREYILEKQIILESAYEFQNQESFKPSDRTYQTREALLEELVFSLGSLIYPKDMLKVVETAMDEGTSAFFKNSDKCSLEAQSQLIKEVYEYLYRFSIERLQVLVAKPSMVALFRYYYNTCGPARVEGSATMNKYRVSYFEAAQRICFPTPYVKPCKKMRSKKVCPAYAPVEASGCPAGTNSAPNVDYSG
jgi:hypothetical protein